MTNDDELMGKHEFYLRTLENVLQLAALDGANPAALAEALAVKFLVRPPAPTITDVERAVAELPAPEALQPVRDPRQRTGPAPKRRKK